MQYQLKHGDCLEVLRAMPDNSVDSIVTDPPYGLTANKKGGSGVGSVNLESPYGRARIGVGNGAGGFMGHKWDSDVPSVEIWAECLRVLKPGGHLLAFAGTRTQHRMAVRIEDAGFEIRDMIAWVYGSGFPKSRNLDGEWSGWGTALKPALEPITVARKPLVGTVAANVLEHGTGALNIDGCRVGGTWAPMGVQTGLGATKFFSEGAATEVDKSPHVLGRWPANLIHDGSDEVVATFPQAPGQQGDLKGHNKQRQSPNGVFGKMAPARDAAARIETDKSAARFFYCAKASRADRNEGLPTGDAPAVTTNATMREREDADWPARNGNHHPTVKPTDLMAYLCRLVTPPGGVVLDPFMGSGSTGKAALREGFCFIGIERDADYLEIARARMAHVAAELERNAESNAQQPSLFEFA